jgi:hypothetical protein
MPIAGLAALALWSGNARADGLSAAELAKLGRGRTVARTQTLELGEQRYVGGVTYTVVDAGPDDVASLLDDARNWRRFLPRTRGAERVGTVGPDFLVELTHGSAIVNVAYTLRVHRQGNVVRFWMDLSRPHDIEDAWGFFRAEAMPAGRTLLTYGILIDMGAGLLRDMFEKRVQELALEVPDGIREAALQRSARGRRASR